MSSFAKGIVVGSVIGAAIGMTGASNTPWMRKKVWKPSKNVIKRASKVMSEVANIM